MPEVIPIVIGIAEVGAPLDLAGIAAGSTGALGAAGVWGASVGNFAALGIAGTAVAGSLIPSAIGIGVVYGLSAPAHALFRSKS